jgi:hypothetical protein
MAKQNTADTTTTTDIDPIVKSNLDLAWMKIEKGAQQEAEGRKLWIEGTLELINILDDARNRLGSDQAFGTWLTDNGYDENLITRHDRSALLNMALDLNLTREVLEQTHRRSWRHIWEEEVQPRLPHAGQPPDAKGPEEASATTRRPRRANGAKKTREEWSKDLSSFFSDGLEAANKAIAVKNSIQQCTPEKKASLQRDVTPVWLEKIKQGGEALAWIRDWANGALEDEADTLIQKGRVRRTPPRASAPVQPSA